MKKGDIVQYNLKQDEDDMFIGFFQGQIKRGAIIVYRISMSKTGIYEWQIEKRDIMNIKIIT